MEAGPRSGRAAGFHRIGLAIHRQIHNHIAEFQLRDALLVVDPRPQLVVAVVGHGQMGAVLVGVARIVHAIFAHIAVLPMGIDA